MTSLERWLLVLVSIVVLLLVIDSILVRRRVKELKASNTALWAALARQGESHQKQISRVWNLARAVDQQIPAVQRLVAQAERNVKGDFWKKGEVYVDGEMADGIGSEAERTRTPGNPDGTGS